LNWRTASETNISHFNVEKSIDGITYTSIGILAATGSSGVHDYSLSDNAPVRGRNFYRLKMIDIDSRFQYSGTAQVDFKETGSFSVSPNPASEIINLKADEPIRKLMLTDINGRLVKEFVIRATNSYKISDIKAGLYILRISTDHGVESIKLLIQ
ncbi:MAG: T9SS type A sorting domain-containing protein, partial [Bacteroidetes bacterium]|nr:T9SS type A sorting domain-containing protein [Bacteroidota bacterium]